MRSLELMRGELMSRSKDGQGSTASNGSTQSSSTVPAASVTGGTQSSVMFKLYPGHGPTIEDGITKISEYIAHRQKRVQKIKDVLRGGGARKRKRNPAESASHCVMTLESITKDVYAETTLSPGLFLAAMINTWLVLRSLERDKGFCTRIVKNLHFDPQGKWAIRSKEPSKDSGPTGDL